MADDRAPQEPADDEPVISARVASLLGQPETWDEPDPGAEERLVASITVAVAAEADQADGDSIAARSAAPDNVVPISAARRWVAPFLAGAAVVLLVVGAVAVFSETEGEAANSVEVALSGTAEAPEATAHADVAATPLGTRIDLSVQGLAPAPEGSYYEAWLRQSPEVGVSAGTFHLRGGDGSIELWAGVGLDEYPLVTVTLQDEGGGAASSGVVVLRGEAG